MTHTALPIRRIDLEARDVVIEFYGEEPVGIELPQTEQFSDYRNVDGVMVPFKLVSNNIANGDIVLRILDLKFDVDIPDTPFTNSNPPIPIQAVAVGRSSFTLEHRITAPDSERGATLISTLNCPSSIAITSGTQPTLVITTRFLTG